MKQKQCFDECRFPQNMIASFTFPYENSYLWHLQHTAPNRTHQWQDWEFDINGTKPEYDAWIVWQSHEGLLQTETRVCPPNKTILVTREPPDILELPPDYVRQFAWVIAPDARLRWHRGHVFSQFGQNWHIEKDYDELTAMEPCEKSRSLSSVVSAKAGTAGQKQRLQLARLLKQEFGDDFDWFGRGINPIKDKWDAVAPYRYHLVMENGQWPHYWTEKLADAFLAWCLPLYVGDPLIEQYFDSRSLIVLNPEQPEECVRKIRQTIQDDAWSRALPHIAIARQRILEQYHLYKMLHDILEREPAAPAETITLRPHFEFSFPWTTKIRWKARNAWRHLVAYNTSEC